MARYNPLGKVPALVTDEGEYWFDSPIIAEYIELLDIAPAMLPGEPLAALKVRQLEALADGIMDAGLVSVREQARPPRSSQKLNCYASGRRSPAVWICWKAIWRTVR